MAECPDGRKNRGTRSQFRIGLPSVGLCKGFYPINLDKIMDAGQSSQISSSSSTSRDLISPCKGTHTLTVREYEQTIDELKKENFNLKLKLYLYDETLKKTCSDKDNGEEITQVVLNLTSDTESLKAKLKDKDTLLQDAQEKIEKLESEVKDLLELNTNLQSELASFSEFPSKEEISMLLGEKENFINHIETLESLIKEKEEEIDTLNEKIEIVSSQNTLLEEKIQKRSLAIQGFVYKKYKEKEMLPDDLRKIVVSAIQAAKNKNKDEVIAATKTFTSALNEIMSVSELSLKQSEEKENIQSPPIMCLKEETSEKSPSSFLSSQTVSPSHIAQIQSSKEVLSERNIADDAKQTKLNSVVHQPYVRGKMIHQNAVNIVDKDFIEFCDISPSLEKNLMSFSEVSDHQSCSVSEHSVINIENVLSPVVCKLVQDKDTLDPDQLVNILKENEELKQQLQEKLAVIKNLRDACEESKGVHLEDNKSNAFKASQVYCASTQTEKSGNNLFNEYQIIKLQKASKLSDNVEELRENVLQLLFAIEEKNKELSDVKQSLAVVQEDLKKALSTTNMTEKDFYLDERFELHERLALSCSVNEELIKHLKELESFIEGLLQHKFDSSLENITEKSAFMSSVSRCLSESLNLSKILSDHLSSCEESKLFEECESFAYKTGSHSEETALPYLGLDRLSMPEQLSSYRAHNSYVQKNSLRTGKESDSSQLCWRCWQQLNPPLNQLEVSHLIQNIIIPKPVGYQSSDSDIWSEPDRNVSMQRIGISLQNSPVSSKSPRKLRQKDKRISSRTSSKENTTSSECQQTSKKRQGSASRRLFVKENANTEDFALEKFYILFAKKISRLESLLNDLKNIKDGELSSEKWIMLNKLVMAVGETFTKLHSAKENSKISPVCGTCAMLDLFTAINSSHVEDIFTEESSSTPEREILQELSTEFRLLKETCKEPFSVFYENINKKSVLSQSNTLIESEKIKKLENIINDLKNKRNELEEKLKNVEHLLSTEKDAVVSVKTEKYNLLTKIDNLKIDLLDMKCKEKELSLTNEKLTNELTRFTEANSELNCILTDFEEKRKESDIALAQLTAELQENKSSLIHMREKCLDYEKQINEQMHTKEEAETKLKNLESKSESEKNDYLRKIDDLNEEKNHCVQDLKALQEKTLALEKENAVIKDRLHSKNNELLSLKETIEKLQSIKETQADIENGMTYKEAIVLESIKSENSKLLNQMDYLREQLSDMKYEKKALSLENEKLIEELDKKNNNYSELHNTLNSLKKKMEESCSTADQLKAELQKNKLDLDYVNKKCLSLQEQLTEEIQVKQKYEGELKTLELNLSAERKKYKNELDNVNAEKNNCEQELKNVKENMFVLEKENAVINNSICSKNDELLSLQKTIEKLQNDKEAITSDHEEANKLVLHLRESSESIKVENRKLSSKLNQLEEELSCTQNKEKELHLKNEKLVEELTTLSKKYSELSGTLKDIELKKEESSIALEQLSAELQKNRLDLIHKNEKCLDYEKQINVHNKEEAENKLKNLESESQSEKNYYLRKIDDLSEEKNNYVQELKALQEKTLALEKENAVVKDRLQSKNNELLSLKEKIEKLQSIKETQTDVENGMACKEIMVLESIKSENSKLSSQVDCLKEELLSMKYDKKELSLENKKLTEELGQINKKYSELNNTLKNVSQKKEDACSVADQLKAELQKNILDFDCMNKKCLSFEKQLNDKIQMNEKCESQLKTQEFNLLNQKDHYEKELKNIQEKLLVLERENANINSALKSKNDEFFCLQKAMEELQNTKEVLISDHEETKILLSKARELAETLKLENHKFTNHITQLEKELSCMKNNKQELCLENEKLAEKFDEVSLNQKNHHEKEFKNIQEKLLVLEKDNANINSALKSKNDEFFCLQKTMEELQNTKEVLLSDHEETKILLSKARELAETLKLENHKLTNHITQLEKELSCMKNNKQELCLENEKLVEKLNEVSLNEKNHHEKELTNIQEKLLVLERENANINSALKSKNDEFFRLQKTMEELKNTKEVLLSDHEETKILLSKARELAKTLKLENHKLTNHITQLEKELSCMKNNKQELCLENEKLVEKFNEVSKCNSKLNSTLKVLQQKGKVSDAEINRLRDELQKNCSDLVDLSEKCQVYENQLSEQIQLKENYENQLKVQKSKLLDGQKYYLSQIKALNTEKECQLQELRDVREDKLNLEKEVTAINDTLQSKNNTLHTLEKTLENVRRDLESKENRLASLEEIVVNIKEREAQYCQQLKQHKAEEKKLSSEIDVLKNEREDILQKLKIEKEHIKKLKAENVQLNESYLKSSQQVSTLKHALSSNKECDILREELKSLRNTLQNLESKCVLYEKQLVAAVGMKDNLIECLLSINNEFSAQRQKLNETCKLYGNDDSVVCGETSSKFIPLINDDNVPKLCENIVSETKKLSQSVDTVLSVLKSHHLKSIETKTSEVKNQAKIESLKKQIDSYKNNVKNLHLQKDQLQHIIDELQNSISEKEKSIQCKSYEIQTVKDKFQSSQKEIDRINELIYRKDDEITNLQERIFNLQTHLSTILTDKKNMLDKTTSITEKSKDSILSNNQLPSKIVLTDTKMCQTDECEVTPEMVDESYTSVSSLESGTDRCCKKCYSRQTKLALCRKRIEILEKEKNDLKERFFQQLQSKIGSAESSDTAVSKLVELEAKLEKKKLFINELKTELCDSYNALIDKEKELDILKQKLDEYEDKFNDETANLNEKQPNAMLSCSVDANIKTLKNHKWRLIQTIFDIQRTFYEKKGIHLNYFERFREHVNNLYSLQIAPPMSKSESMPLLKSSALKEQYEQRPEIVRKMADLELDIECLQNLKIFLNRFLVPCVFQMPEKSDSQAVIVSSDPLFITTERESQKESKYEIVDILNLPIPEAFIMTDKENTFSIDIIASIISQHLDCIEQFLDAVTKRNWLEILEVEDSASKMEAKSVLLKIIQEINTLQEGAVSLFNLNVHLKSFDFVDSLNASLITTKLDASDRESVMSEETIAVSRTESPMSFDDIFHIKLPHPETLKLKESTSKLGLVESKVTVIEPFSNKVTVTDGSCDSVCQRSHYSSPDLGIESDPNHDSSAPEHKEDGSVKYQRYPMKPQPKTAFTNAESEGRWPGPKFRETFYAVGTLPNYELLKQEIKECLVAIKSVLSRTGDGMHHIAKYTSPRKALEYNTLKSIKDTCIHMDVCLKEANNLIGKFWTAPCPTEKEWKILKEENEKLSEELRYLKSMIEKQEIEFKTAMEKLQHAQAIKDNIEKKLSKKLVKTKKLIRHAELKLLETRCQNFPPVPKYSSEQIEQAGTTPNAH